MSRDLYPNTLFLIPVMEVHVLYLYLSVWFISISVVGSKKILHMYYFYLEKPIAVSVQSQKANFASLKYFFLLWVFDKLGGYIWKYKASVSAEVIKVFLNLF